MIKRALGIVICLLVSAGAARAHEISASVLDVTVSGSDVTLSLGAHAHLVDLAVAADADDDGGLTPEELTTARDALARYFIEHLGVTSAGTSCPGEVGAAQPTRRGGAQITIAFHCPQAVAAFDLDNRLFFELQPQHTFIGTLHDGEHAFQLRFDSAHRGLHHEVAGASTLSEASVWSLIGEYLTLGVEHILGGFDHLLFVFTLVIVARRFRDLAVLITSFTLAHSLTLTLAALDLVTLPSSIVEPAIALTILAVAVTNIATRGDRPHRPWLIFLFGLLHGFGFAGALAETGLPPQDVPWALGAFNVGVELGQLAIVSLLWPLVLLLSRKKLGWYRQLVPVSSALVGVMALVWFVQRVQGV